MLQAYTICLTRFTPTAKLFADPHPLRRVFLCLELMSVEHPEPRKASLVDVRAIILYCTISMIGSVGYMYRQSIQHSEQIERNGEKIVRMEARAAEDRQQSTRALEMLTQAVNNISSEIGKSKAKTVQEFDYRSGWMIWMQGRMLACERKLGIPPPVPFRMGDLSKNND